MHRLLREARLGLVETRSGIGLRVPVAAAAGLAALALSGGASAECQAVGLYPGTVYYDNVLTAQSQNATVFGAARTLDREVSPYVRRLSEKDDYAFAIFYGWSMTENAARVPATMSGCGKDGLAWLPYDLHSYNMAFAFRFDNVTFFYSAAGTGGAFVADAGDRAWTGGLSWLGAWLYSYMAPFVGSKTIGIGGGMNHAAVGGKKYDQLRMDYTTGFEYDFSKVAVRAGYVGSKGLYANVEAPDLRVYATSVLNESFSNLAYLSAGLYSLRSVSKELKESKGMTSIYGRKVQSVGVDRTDFNQEVLDPAIRNFDFWTAHLEHRDLKELIDFDVAASVYPKPAFYEGRIALHTPKHNWESQLLDRATRGADRYEGYSAGVHAGVVNLPSLPYYASEGGRVFSFSAEARAFYGGAVLRLMARYNDPDLLAIFPYATGALQFSALVNVVKR